MLANIGLITGSYCHLPMTTNANFTKFTRPQMCVLAKIEVFNSIAITFYVGSRRINYTRGIVSCLSALLKQQIERCLHGHMIMQEKNNH